jgi:hypothetical protein
MNPTVNGLGFAAIRDLNSFLRHATSDDFGTPNPLARDVTRIYTETSSQPARTLNDFTHLGFNQDENGKKVFDGMMQWVGAGDGINMNYRWSQTKRTERNRQEESFTSRASSRLRTRRPSTRFRVRPTAGTRNAPRPTLVRWQWSSIRPTSTG